MTNTYNTFHWLVSDAGVDGGELGEYIGSVTFACDQGARTFIEVDDRILRHLSPAGMEAEALAAMPDDTPWRSVETVLFYRDERAGYVGCIWAPQATLEHILFTPPRPRTIQPGSAPSENR